MGARDLFISHSSGDAETARALRSMLEGAGYSCWMAPDDIVGTETWTEQILAAIADSKAMIVLVSTAANKSAHVSREVNLALGRSRAVLPIRIEAVAPEGSLEYLLSLVQRVDAFPPPVTDHAERILRRLATVIDRPQSQPAAAPTLPETTPVERPKRRSRKAQATTPTPMGTTQTPPPTGTTPATAGTSDAQTAASPVPIGPTTLSSGVTPTPLPTGATPATAGPTPAAPTESPQRTEAPATPPAPSAPVVVGPGAVIGSFTLEALLGEGGMATVYRARQAEPNRLVAIKVIRADHALDETYRQRFLAEKQTLAGLEHPSIVPIYAAGDSHGVLYIAMRLVDGPDLQVRIASQERLSLRETVQILEPIADAVDHAHAAGVIHRDLKPSNIILDRAGRPYLTDFGLGKQVAVDSQLSSPGVAIGTLDFMAPEQFTGNTDPKLAPSIDIYALGCVAFQCLTGQAPFKGESPQQLMYAHTHQPPPSLRALRPEYPPAIDAVFEKVLAKDPAARYPSARAFVAALDSVVQLAAAGQTSAVVVPSQQTAAAGARRWIGRNTALAVGGGAVALVAAVILGAGLVFSPGSSPGPTQGGGATAGPSPVVPTSPPTAGVTTGPTAAATAEPLTAAQERLVGRLPALGPAASGCSSWSTPPGGEDVLSPSGYAGSVARLTCPAPSGDSPVRYAEYPSRAALEAEYDAIMSDLGVAPGGACATTIPANNVWNFPGFPESGDLACFQRDGRVQYVWTHFQLRLLAQWLAPDNATGFAFWQSWTTTFSPIEQDLLADLPVTVDDAGACTRAADKYYETALAIIACPRAGENAIFFARFPSAEAFPDDPMTAMFDSILTGGGFPDDTEDACYESVLGRYTWGYLTGEGTGETEGYVGCYLRTDATPATTQMVWTFNRTAVMGLWNAPDVDTGTAVFDQWIGDVR